MGPLSRFSVETCFPKRKLNGISNSN
uniref:Uncharacterized protein n=1 Tax=Anguilla anguilla TaxID=7936 RepID=A0A0E9QN18_ANGAN